eukprot:1190188-Prorocentrum_minimum.AAC.1
MPADNIATRWTRCADRSHRIGHTPGNREFAPEVTNSPLGAATPGVQQGGRGAARADAGVDGGL